MISIIIDVGYIDDNLHYGPYASYWWQEKMDPITKAKILFPIRIKLNTQHIMNEVRMNCFVDIDEKNRPVFVSSIGQFIESAGDMTSSVNSVYNKILNEKYPDNKRTTKLNGTNFFGMGDKDQLSKIMADVTFRPFIINENKFKMLVISASSHNGIDPADGYHITFKEQYKRETIIFSQFYEKYKFI